MNSMLVVGAMASLAAFGQRIDIQKADRLRITRVATSQNHLTVLEFNEPVKEVAVGSSNFKVEWRENKVFVQPLEPDGTTNLFVWTGSGRQSYELVPAGSVGEMHFAIDEQPATQARQEPAPPAQPPRGPAKVPAAMLMESTPVRSMGMPNRNGRVRIVLQDVYDQGGRTFLRYTIVNASRTAYVAAQPDLFRLSSPRSPQTLIPLAATQLSEDYPLRWKDQVRIAVQQAEFQAPTILPGQTAHGVIAFDLPARVQPGERIVVRLSFPADAVGGVSAFLVL